jgi:hypothetical protein
MRVATYEIALTLTPEQRAQLVKTVRQRIWDIEAIECNRADVRLELYAEMAALRVVLAQLGERA